MLLFGAKRLRNIGGDLGAAVKGFKSSMNDQDDSEKIKDATEERVIEGEADVDKAGKEKV